MGSVHNLKTPVMAILTLLITFCDHGVGLRERVRSGNLEAGVLISFRVFDEAARSPDVEVVQSRMGVALEREMRLVRRVSSAWRTALIVPPLEVVTLAWPFGSLAHGQTIGQPAGFLMTISRLEIVGSS